VIEIDPLRLQRRALTAALLPTIGLLAVSPGTVRGQDLRQEHPPRLTVHEVAGRCPDSLAGEPVAPGCALVLRYLRAQLAGDVWTGRGDPDLPPGDSGAVFGAPSYINLSMSAHAAIDPRVCASALTGDTLSLLVQYGVIGEVDNDNVMTEYAFGELGLWRDGEFLGVRNPPYAWAIREYQAVGDRGQWRLVFAANEDDAPYPLIGISGATRVYRGKHRARFETEMQQAAAGLRALPRPPCPTFSTWDRSSELN
jgi:hypothetical protein